MGAIDTCSSTVLLFRKNKSFQFLSPRNINNSRDNLKKFKKFFNLIVSVLLSIHNDNVR